MSRIEDSNSDLAAPHTMKTWTLGGRLTFVIGGRAEDLWVGTFASPVAADHFVRYCVEQEKQFAGVKLSTEQLVSIKGLDPNQPVSIEGASA